MSTVNITEDRAVGPTVGQFIEERGSGVGGDRLLRFAPN